MVHQVALLLLSFSKNATDFGDKETVVGRDILERTVRRQYEDAHLGGGSCSSIGNRDSRVARPKSLRSTKDQAIDHKARLCLMWKEVVGNVKSCQAQISAEEDNK